MPPYTAPRHSSWPIWLKFLQVGQLLLDPAVQRQFRGSLVEMEGMTAQAKALQDELQAVQFSQDSKAGRMLMAKCRALQVGVPCGLLWLWKQRVDVARRGGRQAGTAWRSSLFLEVRWQEETSLLCVGRTRTRRWGRRWRRERCTLWSARSRWPSRLPRTWGPSTWSWRTTCTHWTRKTRACTSRSPHLIID